MKKCPVNIRYDHLVAIERCGRAEDGNYYNMRGVNLKHLVDPIDDLFIAAQDIAGITTTGRTLKHPLLFMASVVYVNVQINAYVLQHLVK